MDGGTAPAPAPALLPAPSASGPVRGGGRGRAITVDPRMITDFDEMTAIPFAFAKHPMYPEAHVFMNGIYADAFLDIDDLFTVTTPPSRDTFVTDPITVIKNKIRDESIVPNAVNATDATAINPQ